MFLTFLDNLNRFQTGYLSFSIQIILCLHRRLSDAARVESEGGGAVYTNSSPSDEGTPFTATPPSTEQPITAQGEKHKLV